MTVDVLSQRHLAEATEELRLIESLAPAGSAGFGSRTTRRETAQPREGVESAEQWELPTPDQDRDKEKDEQALEVEETRCQRPGRPRKRPQRQRSEGQDLRELFMGAAAGALGDSPTTLGRSFGRKDSSRSSGSSGKAWTS